jgi:TATA-binding protein-associated factor
MFPSIHDHNFLSVIIDEVHMLRKQCPSFVRLTRYSAAEVLMTATPLHTAPVDLYCLGALINIGTLGTNWGYDEWRNQEKEINRAKKLVTKDDLNEEASHLGAGDLDAAPPSSLMFWVQANNNVIRWMMDRFLGCIIRRTKESTDWQGNKLGAAVVPYEEKTYYLKTSNLDLDILHQHASHDAKE